MTMIEMDIDYWYEKFEPMENHIHPSQGNMFETFGEDAAYIYSIDPHFVWTEMDGDDGGIYMVEGRHFVNRIAYYVTRLPWLDSESYDICVVEAEPLSESEYCLECGIDVEAIACALNEDGLCVDCEELSNAD